MGVLRWLERLLVLVGVVCLGSAGTTWLEARRFQQEQSHALELARVDATTPAAVRATAGGMTGPIGRLDIPRLGVSAVVMPGEDEATLAKAIGHLSDTPLPWYGGNTALAGHRDTFFRPLEHVQIGDDMFLNTPHGRFRYRVRRTAVVEPEALWVLGPTREPTLTLITCYPFRYVGPAPQRFIVQADRI